MNQLTIGLKAAQYMPPAFAAAAKAADLDQLYSRHY